MAAHAEAHAPGAPGTMRAATIAAPRRAEMRTSPRPEPGRGEVRIRLAGSGVCASNLPLWEGREWFAYPQLPGAPGHEGWGTIDALGEGVRGLECGMPVAALSYHAYAEYDLASADAVVPLPPELARAPFPGEPLGCAMNILARSGIEPGQTVAIVGIGFLGAVLTHLAAQRGARVLAISRRPFALDVARDAGADVTIPFDDAAIGVVTERVMQLTGGAGCERVIEAVGLQSTLDLASALTRERGRLVIAGYHQDGARRVDMQSWNWRGLDVINAHERDPAAYVAGMRAAAEVVSSGAFDPTPLYTHRFALDAVGEALEAARTRPDGFLKALVIA